ncbi:TrmH family RNA methyltransferase [Oribacterium sp. WCC10]|uniref:TrmH family RNA methyltransferase n=1 Tax=Oribacterium sp. WCC10 TaxID=1855343 RepID=UPI0008E246AB|nr:RNA methyltransferase [Oribacterium sp. WCC10]SFG68849.1 tRNA G18 (ribose-2'-O)-methylase SpoU [Oribacterium sp. WCC10]
MNLDFINISDIKDSKVAVFSQYNEGQLLHYNEPDTGIFIAESPKVIFRALDAGYEPGSLLVEDKTITGRETKELWERLKALEIRPSSAEESNMEFAGTKNQKNNSQDPEPLPVYVGSSELLSQITGFKLTRGVLCAMRRKELPDVHELCKNCRRIAVLENVVNPTNVGAIFRSAAALNIDAVLLTGGCSDPLYRRSARVSMGTVFQIPWTYVDSWPSEGMSLLKDMGFKTAAMALRDRSVNITHQPLLDEEKLAIILGTEGEGLMNETIESSDYVVKIPMSHGVDSLNVAAASAVIFWQLGLNA